MWPVADVSGALVGNVVIVNLLHSHRELSLLFGVHFDFNRKIYTADV